MIHINWNSPKKYLWVINAFLFNIDRVFSKRNNKIWIFGAWGGNKYEDNTRYLFEYVNKYHKDIRAIWFTKTKRNEEIIRNCGYEAYCWDCKEAKFIQKKAGIVVYTHGLMDFGLLPRVGGATIVSLWHGVGFKKTYNAKYSGWQLWIKKNMDKIFSWTYRDITMVTSEYTRYQFSGIFSLSRKDIVCTTGQPRNDIFHTEVQKHRILQNLGINSTKNIILYMPTYRSSTMGVNAMEDIIRHLYKSAELDNALDQTNSILIIKPHPLTPPIHLANRNNFIILDYYLVENNQKLLAVSDTLISDYSSCIVDFALLQRPIIFFLPDHKTFIEKSEPLYKEFLDICESEYCTTAEQLAKKLTIPSMNMVNAINALYEDINIKGTCYTENVYNAIIEHLK